jgi:hypothetical protein
MEKEKQIITANEKSQKSSIKPIETIETDIIFNLAKTAVEKADMGTLEKLVDLRKQMQAEIAKKEFYKALNEFQAELKPIKKSKVVLDKKTGQRRFSYATYDDIIEAIQPLLKKYGLSYQFKTRFEENAVIVDCIITHYLGHQEVTSFRAPVIFSGHMLPIQEWGSALTYAKRYSLSLALGLATEEDTEFQEFNQEIKTPEEVGKIEEAKAEIYKQIEEKTKEEKTKEEKTIDKITESQRKYILDMLHKNNISMNEFIDFASFAIQREIKVIGDLTKTEARQIIEKLKNWIEMKNTEKEVLKDEE